jgi:MscS family membrane protein
MSILALGFLLGWLTVVPVAAQTGIPGMPAGGVAEDIEKAAEKERSEEERAALGSPRATMRTFLEGMEQLWESPVAGWKLATMTLDLPPSAQSDQARDRARQLYGVLNRIGLVEVDALPGADEVASKSLESFRYFPDRRTQRAALERFRGPPSGSIVLRVDEDGLWHFDRETVRRLPALFAQMESMPLVAGGEVLTVAQYIEEQMPGWLAQGTFLTVAYWQWLSIFLLILFGLFVDLLVRFGLRRAEPRDASQSERTERRRQLRPLGQLAALAIWWFAARFLEIDGLVGSVVSGALAILLAAFGTLAAWRLTDLLGNVLAARAKQTERRIDDVLVPLLVRALKIFVLVVATVFAAEALDVPLTPLLASITVASVAFSFAAKDTVENFFGSIAVLFDRPFDIGDWVVVDSTEGIVEEVGFRSTRVRTFYNSLVTVPNANLVRAVVDNYGRRRYRRWKTTLGVQYDTPPDVLVSFTEGLRELIRLHPYTRKDYYEIHCNDFGASSLDILFYVFFEVPDWSTELRERERLFLDILRLADRLGVQFAFPTSTVHLFEGQVPDSPEHQAPGRTTEALRSLQGARIAQELVAAQPWREKKPDPVRVRTGPTQVQLDDAGNPIVPDDVR